jgi:hypothetical protein
MVHILRLRDTDYYPQEEWDIGSVLAKRRALMCDIPIISTDITELDVWLLRQPDLPLEILGQIWMRTMLCLPIMYKQENDPEVRRSMLLSLRDSFEEFKLLPENWQEQMRPCWLPWLDVLRREERLEGCNGSA